LCSYTSDQCLNSGPRSRQWKAIPPKHRSQLSTRST
jgi:hypothetical protein